MPTGVYIRTASHIESMRASRLGKHLTTEHKQKISVACQGIYPSDESRRKMSIGSLGKNKGKASWNTGLIKETDERVARISLAKIGENNPMFGRVGENHPNWQGGISENGYPFEFDEELKERIRGCDNHTCQLCGVPQAECIRKLDVHHIDYDKENLADENLITLCSSCNLKVNFNREYWTKYLQEKSNGNRSQVKI